MCHEQGVLNYLTYAGDENLHGGVPWLVQRRGSSTLINHIGAVFPRNTIDAHRDAVGYVLDDDGSSVRRSSKALCDGVIELLVILVPL